MNLIVSGHHVEVTAAMREYVAAKMDRVLRHFDNVIEVNVIMSVQKLLQKAEVSVHLRGKDIHVECIEENMYASIDSLVDKLDRQILKHKGKAYAHPHDTLKRSIAVEE